MKEIEELILYVLKNARENSEASIGEKKINKCEVCGKSYRFPRFVFKPRDRVCFTCEAGIEAYIAFHRVACTQYGLGVTKLMTAYLYEFNK